MTDNSQPAAPQIPSSPSSGFSRAGLFSLHINFLAFCLAIVLTMAGVKLSSLLPDVMYFSFSRSIDTSKKPTLFLIQPSHMTRDELCKALEKNEQLKSMRCDATVLEEPEGAKKADSANDDVAVEANRALADRFIREQAQNADLFRGIFGLVIRLAIPCLAGFLVVRLFGAEDVMAVALGAGAAALLLCWPVVMLWDYVVTKEWQDFHSQFLALYTLYIIMFFYMGRLGGMISAAVRTPVFTLNYGKVIETVTITVVGGVLTKFLEASLIIPRK